MALLLMGTEFGGKVLRLTPPLPLGVVLMSHRSQPCQGPHSAKLLLPQVETPSLRFLSTSPPEAWPACAEMILSPEDPWEYGEKYLIFPQGEEFLDIVG